MSRVSPVLLLIIEIVAAIFFAFGLLHLLVRYLVKRRSFSSISQSNRNRDNLGSQVYQRQLQQLFRLHDSGLDQALVDALPIFYYKDIMGLKEPFDCAVCLCVFSEKDILRLLPSCGHAFHIHCIDTWLLSNSTCPLCRALISSGLPLGNSLVNFNESRERWDCFSGEIEIENFDNHNPGIMQENAGEMLVFSIRLGKFGSMNEGDEIGDRSQKEVSSCNLDVRRCYSMGTFQYVVGSELQVALCNINGNGANVKPVSSSYENGHFASNKDKDGKKISARTRGESYSVSKIWLWSKKDSSQSSSNTNNNVTSHNVGMPTFERTQLV